MDPIEFQRLIQAHADQWLANKANRNQAARAAKQAKQAARAAKQAVRAAKQQQLAALKARQKVIDAEWVRTAKVNKAIARLIKAEARKRAAPWEGVGNRD